MPPEEIENHPFQGRKAVVQLTREQMARCKAVHFALSSQKKMEAAVIRDKPILDVQRCHLKFRGKVSHGIVVLIDIPKN